MSQARFERKMLEKENRKHPTALKPIPPEKWPDAGQNNTRFQVWRSRFFLVQAFNEPGGVIRLSVNRTKMLPSGRWDDAITWDELQMIKAQAGYMNSFAIEIFPAEDDVVNVANMRHLWILPEPLNIGWRQ